MIFEPLVVLKKYFLQYRRIIIWGFLSVVLTNIIALITPLIVKRVVDDLVQQTTSGKLVRYAGLILSITIVQGFFLFWMRWLLIGVSRKVEYALRNDFFAHLLTLSRSFYQKSQTGDLMARATNDLEAVRNLLGPAVMYTASTLVTIPVAFGLMLSLSWQLWLVSLIPLPLLSLAVYFISPRINKLSRQIQEQYAVISNLTQENLSGVRVIRSYLQEPFEIARFKVLNLDFIRRNLQLARLSALFNPALAAFGGISLMIVIWYGGQLVILNQITLGALVAFLFYLQLLTWPMIALGWVVGQYQMGTASLGRIQQIMQTQPEIVANGKVKSIASIRGHITFNNLSFEYTGGNQLVLKKVNLEIPQGKTFAIVGATGSGKTTLVNLLTRLFPVRDGSITIDGYDLNEIPLPVLRRSIGFVTQEPFLFSETLASNIGFGLAQFNLEKIKAACEIADLNKDIATFPAEYETIIGERGINLSGGQRQRVAIARAVILEPPILILDDAFASVDTETEENILSRLRQFAAGRTVILISHRISTVKAVDQIVVLDNGEIIERGNHTELLSREGAYAQLHRRQLLEEELEKI